MVFLIGLLIGLLLGAVALGEVLRIAFLTGRLTVREIADHCDRLIDAADSPTEAPHPRGPRTL